VVTVKLYRRLAMEKMGAESLADLVKMWEKR
jgi:FixJ family two-component response regulator